MLVDKKFAKGFLSGVLITIPICSYFSRVTDLSRETLTIAKDRDTARVATTVTATVTAQHGGDGGIEVQNQRDHTQHSLPTIEHRSHYDLVSELLGASASSRSISWRSRREFDKQAAINDINLSYQPSSPGHDLTDTDRKILGDLCFKSNAVYETGVGESTKICTFTGVPRMTAVDNAVAWLDTVRKSAPTHYRFHWADIGPIAEYSNPTDPLAKPKWPLASMAALAAEGEPFDLYIVDGRFRVASFAANMLHAVLHGKTDALFTMHDYPPRPNYHVIEQIGTLIRGAGIDAGAEIAVFKMKDGVTKDQIVSLWEQYKYDRE